MNQLLEIEDLHLCYESRHGQNFVLNGAQLQLESGKSLGIVGESGCGKSTLAHAIAGLLPHTATVSGSPMIFNGNPLDPKGHGHLGPDIGMIFQDPMASLNPFLKIETQMIEGLCFHQNMSKAEAIEIACHWLEEVQLPHPKALLKKYPHECSGGMCQRIAIAMTMSLEPVLLIADEPTTALDVSSQAKVLSILKQAREGRDMALILVSHDMGVISQVCENISVMYAGQMVECGSTEDVLAQPQHPYTQSLLTSRPPLTGPCPSRLPSLSGAPPRLSSRAHLCPFWERCPSAHEACRKEPAPKKVFKQQSYLCHGRAQ